MNCKCIRVEHIRGKGFCNSAENVYITHGLKGLGKRHFCTNSKHPFPAPIEEDLNMYRNGLKWFCAFPSIEMLNKIITPNEIKALLKHGYSIYELRVKEYQVGYYQVIYTKDSIISKKCINHKF